MLGFGSANFNQGTFGKGVIQAHGSIASASSTQTFGVAIWEATQAQIVGTSSLTNFGGLSKGGTTLINGITTMQGHPNFVWAGFNSSSEQSTVSTFGYIAWDGQLVADATWTNQTVS